MNRRDLLKGMAAGAAGATLTASGSHSGAGASPMGSTAVPKGLLRDLQRQPLINRAQAQKVMEEYELAGMLAMNPVNVYYLSNTMPVTARMRHEYPAFATLPRNQDEPVFLVTSTMQAWDIANGDRWVPEIVRTTAPRNAQAYMGAAARPLSEQPDAVPAQPGGRDPARLTEREERWVDAETSGKPAPTLEWGLARAMQDSGIVRGRVAVDDMRIALLLERIGLGKHIEFIDGDNLFRRIRYIKSPVEIDYLRIAGQNNCRAAMATIAGLEVGMTEADVQQGFLAEAAQRGNEFTFLVAGTSLGSFRQGRIVEGEPFLVDAVSHFREYHGDFGRTVVVGEPGSEVKKRARAQGAAREAAFSALRPGVKYSAVAAAGCEAFRKAGGPVDTFFVVPHSVGLQHTDQPYQDDSPFRAGEDLTLEPGMVITVDLPYLDMGFGAGHNEDLLLITDDGYEPLHESPGNLIVV